MACAPATWHRRHRPRAPGRHRRARPRDGGPAHHPSGQVLDGHRARLVAWACHAGPGRIRGARCATPRWPRSREKVTMELDDEINAAYPRQWIGRVTVHTTDGRTLGARVDVPAGRPGQHAVAPRTGGQGDPAGRVPARRHRAEMHDHRARLATRSGGGRARLAAARPPTGKLRERSRKRSP